MRAIFRDRADYRTTSVAGWLAGWLAVAVGATSCRDRCRFRIKSTSINHEEHEEHEEGRIKKRLLPVSGFTFVLFVPFVVNAFLLKNKNLRESA
ncbi:MAG TPA: hypothetical protein VJ908_00635 [Wenzhouxiangellaceae bacterium]|nr:hypothetical protein [Wenzhouxiangellaceae bacterium]